MKNEIKRAWLFRAHRTHRDGISFMWHQLCQRCKYITSVEVQKRAIKKAIRSCRITCERSESARKWRIALYEKRSIIIIIKNALQKKKRGKKSHSLMQNHTRTENSAIYVCKCSASITPIQAVFFHPFRQYSSTHSDSILPPIQTVFFHPFRQYSSTHSDSILPPIQTVFFHPFRQYSSTHSDSIPPPIQAVFFHPFRQYFPPIQAVFFHPFRQYSSTHSDSILPPIQTVFFHP